MKSIAFNPLLHSIAKLVSNFSVSKIFFNQLCYRVFSNSLGQVKWHF